MPQPTSPVTLADAFATVEALHKARSVRATADALGMRRSTLQDRIAKLRRLAREFATWEAQMTPTSCIALVEPEPAPETVAAPVPANDEPTPRPEP